MSKVKWAVWGSCGIARRRTIPEGIIPAKNADLVSIYDVNAKVNRELAGQLGVQAAASDKELLAGTAQAVYIATPAYLHCEQVLACAKAGKHVLCEKPLGMTTKEAEQMISACEDSGVQLGVAFMMRFQSQHQAALELIRDGKLGQPVYARAQLSCWYPPIEDAWRQNPARGGGGALMDMGGHCIDLLEMFFGRIEKLACFTNNLVHNYKSEDSATVLLHFRNGALGTVDTFFCIPDASSKNILELYGSRGSILARGTIGQGQAGEMTAFLEAQAGSYDAQQSRSAADGLQIAPQPVNMYRAEIEEFSQALLDGRETSLDASLGLQSNKVISACYESVRMSRTIELSY